jgi:3-hydroxyisobutyrate dehydrogenase
MVTRNTGTALKLRDIALIDAPVSGGVAKATTGTLTIMIGNDDAAALAKAKPVLSCMGTTFFEVGGQGSGHAAKALNNVVAAANYAVLAEAMLTAERYGIEPDMFVDFVSATCRIFVRELDRDTVFSPSLRRPEQTDRPRRWRTSDRPRIRRN